MATGWFPLAVHALALLSTSEDGYSSSYIAGSVNTHSVFLRKVLAKLVTEGILATREGARGGYRLLRPAQELTLAEVYRVMEPDGVLSPSVAEPNVACPVGAGIRAAFGEVMERVDTVVLAELETLTVADIASRAIEFGKERSC
ncbi:Rrf2 family transcriptional regulator [Tumebacillus flagellatus]|uniref:Rrf2 family transcriptional regulator n=1 Tax=Tumebacillus flagellatus TaxID=1157490 RepID=A0A074LVU3_9BACL|nr:Rrf2 family transcriptional regulator [Tumebacillus flagellatus]KEO84143.1 hypothetical protein EL26_06670 [Tumebacillus flagellatus]